jgi:glycosyltransferase involved in cell wall biosynthesis
MKITIISCLYEPYVAGGVEVYLKTIVSELARRREISIITTQPYVDMRSLAPALMVSGRVKVYRFYPLNFYHMLESKNKPASLKPLWHLMDFFNPHACSVVKSILKREKPDIVHTHNLNGLSVAIAPTIKRLGFPLAHTVHDFGLLCPYTCLTCSACHKESCEKPLFGCAFYRNIKRTIIMLNKPDAVIFPSQSVLKLFSSVNFFGTAKLEQLFDCIEPLTHVEVRRTPDKYFTILYAGQLVKHKGVQVLIEAFKKFSDEKVRLKIAGSGEYEQQLRLLGDGDIRISFLGKLSHEKMDQVYASADVTVVPSVWPEVLGIVILESFNAGVPVVGSNVGGIPEIIKNGRNGFLFEPNNDVELFEILKRLRDDPGLLEQLKQHASKDAEEFSVAEHVKRLEKIYSETIDRCRLTSIKKPYAHCFY